MKKVSVFLLSLVLVLLCGCVKKSGGEPQNRAHSVGVWFSYNELDRFLEGNLEEEYAKALENCKKLGITDVFVHVRPYCDAIYPSKLFPMRETAKGYDDALSVLIDVTHKANMRFHAWINPYRVRTADEDITKLPQDSPVSKWLNDDDSENDADVIFCNGIYLAPSSPRVRRLVIDGVRELLENYEVDGIHFDDYFYPTADEQIDGKAYDSYRNSTQIPLSLRDWRIANVDTLISGTYTAVKGYGEYKLFSVSPAASLEKNKQQLFADVEAWMSAGTVDIIIPQLYFGFEYPQKEFRFENLLAEWSAVERAENVELWIGLGAYKLNEASLADYAEWSSDSSILSRQTELCRQNTEVCGHVYYSYTALFSNEHKNKQALYSLLGKEEKYVEKN